MRKSLSIATAVLIVSLAGCKQEQAETEKAPQAQPTQAETSKPAAAPEPTPAQKTEPKAQDTAQDTETITDKACLAAVTKETGEADVSVTSNEFSEANTVVMLSVGAQQAPWRCLVSNDGQVAEVSFEGDDSAGVSNQPMSSDNPMGSSDVSQTAIDACLGAVSRETNENNVEVLSSEYSEANSQVMVGVGEQKAPWRCLVSNDGQVAEVMFEGTDGGNVTDQAPNSLQVDNDLADFLGAKGGQAEMGLNNRGYRLARTQGLTAFWWNENSENCAKIVTSDGRYQSIDNVSPGECEQ